jgi:hypothetical protein
MTDESPVPADGADQTPASQPVEQPVEQPVVQTEAQPAAAAVPPPPAAPRVRWQDRVLRLPAVVGVALATLIMGGLGGAGLGALVHGRDHHDGWGDRHGMGEGPGWMGDGHMGDGRMGDGRMGPGYGYGPGPNQMGPNQMGPNQMGPNQNGTSGSNG